MAYSAQRTPYGTYEIFRDGQRISTGSESALSNYGLSPTQLSYVPPKTPPAPAYNAPPPLAPTGIAASSAIGMRPELPPVSPDLPPGAPQTPQSTPYTIKDFDDGSQWEVDATGKQIKQVRPPNIPQNVYDYYRNLSSQGQQSYSPQETLAKLQGQISQGLYSGSVDEKKLFPSGVPGSTTPYGQTADVFKNLSQTAPQTPAPAGVPKPPFAGTTPPAGPVGGTTGEKTGGDTSGTSYLQRLYELVLGQQTPSAKETETQSQLDALTAQQAGVSGDLALRDAALGTLPIAKPIISGHQAEQLRLANAQMQGLGAQAVPLQTQLAREQAKRQASLDVAKFAYGEAKDVKKSEQEQQRYAQDSAFKQQQLDIQKQQNVSSQDLARQKFDEDKRQYGLDYALKQRELASKEGKGMPVVGSVSYLQKQAQSQQNISLIDSLKTDKGLNVSVGPNALARISFATGFTGERQNFIASVEQLRSQLNLDTLVKAKEQGATFGALSDNELQVLASAATKIGTWVVKDKNNKILGYNTTEANFKKELDTISNFAKLDFLLKGGKPEDIGLKKMPDNTVWAPNSDGTITQLI